MAVMSPQRSSQIDSPASELGDRRVNVITHEVELVMTGVVGRVRGQFGGRESEDEPAVAGIDRREFEDVSDECANRVRALGEDDRVGAGDHASPPIVASWDPPPAASVKKALTGRRPVGCPPSGL